MPFKSKAQVRAFYAKEKRHELPKGTAHRWAEHTPNMSNLPEHVKKSASLRLAFEKGVALADATLFGKTASSGEKALAAAALQALVGGGLGAAAGAYTAGEGNRGRGALRGGLTGAITSPIFTPLGGTLLGGFAGYGARRTADSSESNSQGPHATGQQLDRPTMEAELSRMQSAKQAAEEDPPNHPDFDRLSPSEQARPGLGALVGAAVGGGLGTYGAGHLAERLGQSVAQSKLPMHVKLPLGVAGGGLLGALGAGGGMYLGGHAGHSIANSTLSPEALQAHAAQLALERQQAAQSKQAAEDATHPPPDDDSAPKPDSKPSPNSHGETSPSLANLSPEEVNALMAALGLAPPSAGPDMQSLPTDADAGARAPDKKDMAPVPGEHERPMHGHAGAPGMHPLSSHKEHAPHKGPPGTAPDPAAHAAAHAATGATGPQASSGHHPAGAGPKHPADMPNTPDMHGAPDMQPTPSDPGDPPDMQATPDLQDFPPELIAQLLAELQAQGGAGSGPGINGNPTATGGVPTSEDFVNFVQGDQTDETADPNAPPPTQPGGIKEKPPHWSGGVSLEGGDAGTRNHQMGLPASGAV